MCGQHGEVKERQAVLKEVITGVTVTNTHLTL